MDHHPSSLTTSSFPNPSPASSSYNLADIWHQFPLTANAALEDSNRGAVLGARRPNFLHGFAETLDESALTDQHTGRNACAVLAPKKRRDGLACEDESSSKLRSTSTGNEMNDIDGKRLRICGTRDENGDPKAEVEASSGIADKPADQSSQPSDTPKQDYIHVRARRGQATDSHSLAERARREKISERMKILQDLVPGCNKVIGKAMVLDEIINYIQSLQRQVEFLSMKLEAVNSRVNPSMDVYPPKDFGAPTYDAAGLAFGQQATRDYGQGSPPEWLHMQVGGSFERAT